MSAKKDCQKRISLNLRPSDWDLIMEFPGISITSRIEWAIRTASELTGRGKKSEDSPKGEPK